MSLETLAFQIARGVARGLIEGAAEAYMQASVAVEEAVTDVDRARAVRFRAAVQRVCRAGDPVAVGSSPLGQADLGRGHGAAD